ncbi:MAG: DUF3179 domain-containing protein [Agarilytica sp.]
MLNTKHGVSLFYFVIFFCSLGVRAESLNGFDISNSILQKGSIKHGGPPRDGIPAIYKPQYIKPDEANFLKEDDIVLGFEMLGQAYAYPRYILNWHELVNDDINEQPFLISYCPLCGTGMAFSSLAKNREMIFGVSGLLYNSDLLFYDKQTESLWSQIEGRAVTGKMMGERLKQLPLVTTTWKRWRELHPKTNVLSEKQGVRRNYRRDPYSGYETSSMIFFKTLREAPPVFHPKEKVLGVTINGKSKAYAFSRLKSHGKKSFVDSLGGEEYRVVYDAKTPSAKTESLKGEAMVSTIAFWFAWYNFYPESEVFE